MQKRKLIVNADDFGFNREITDAIIRCHAEGCVTSTTMMAHMPAAEYAAEQSREYPDLSVGIHLSINTGRPLSDPKDIPALVDQEGNFKNSSEIVRLAKHCRLPTAQVEREFTLQVEKFLSLGLTPSHCDSHQNITVNPQPLIAMMRVARKFGIAKMRTYRGLYRLDRTEAFRLGNMLRMLRVNLMRGPKSAYYGLLHRYWRLRGYRLPDFKDGLYKVVSSSPLKYDIQGWKILIENLRPGISELTVHPSLPGNDPLDRAEFHRLRVSEYELLSDPTTRRLCEQAGVELVSYRVV